MKHHGFALAELLTVLLVIATMGRIAVPYYDARARSARADRVLDEVRNVETAARGYRAATRSWPADGDPGEVPGELGPRLPDGFSFLGDGYSLDWERWPLPGGLPDQPGAERLLGVTVRFDDPGVGEAFQELARDEAPLLVVDDAYTFLIGSG